MIPKIIHQTWKDNNLPIVLKKIVEANKKNLEHFGYEFKLWTDDDIIELIKQNYPFLFNIFSNTRTGVQKGDIARLVLVHHFGGIYIDLDILIMKNPEELIDFDQDKLNITFEPSAQTLYLYNKNDYICNAFFASNSNNKILDFALQNIEAIFQRNGPYTFSKFDVFGGSYLKGIIDSYVNHRNLVNIIEDRERIFPINDLKFDNLPSSKTNWDMVRYNQYNEKTIMVHYWIHGDFESKNLLYTFDYDDSKDISQNMYIFFSTLYPNISKKMLL